MLEDSQARVSRSNYQPIGTQVAEQPSPTVHYTHPFANNDEYISFRPHQSVIHGLTTAESLALYMPGVTEPFFPPTATAQTDELSRQIWTDTQSEPNRLQWTPAHVASIIYNRIMDYS